MGSIDDLPKRWRDSIRAVNTSDPKYLDLLIDVAEILVDYELLKERLNEKVRIKLKTKNIVKQNEILFFISRYFLSHQYQLGVSIFELAKLGYGNSMTILVRSLLENLINLSYLWLTKIINSGSVKERIAWYKYYESQKISMHEKLTEFFKHRQSIQNPVADDILTSVPQEILQKFKEFKQDYKEQYSEFDGGKYWSKHKKLDKRAREVDNTGRLEEIYLEVEYILVYKTSSQLVHGTSGIVSLYTEADTEQISFGSNFETSDRPLKLAHKYLVFSSEVIAKISNITL